MTPSPVLRTPDARFEGLAGYPFPPNYRQVETRRLPPLRMHYVDAGPADGPIVLLTHGQPTWSYLYRTVIPVLVDAGLRVIAPDNIGYGRSDKLVEAFDYTFARHVDWLHGLVVGLDLRDVTLVVQDWGGPIGLSVLARDPDRFARVVATNTILHTCDPTLAGELTWAHHGVGQTRMLLEEALLDYVRFYQRAPDIVPSFFLDAVAGPLRAEVLAAYDAPFPDRSFTAGLRHLIALIPLTRNDPGAVIGRSTMAVLERWESRSSPPIRTETPRPAGGTASSSGGYPVPTARTTRPSPAQATSSRSNGVTSWVVSSPASSRELTDADSRSQATSQEWRANSIASMPGGDEIEGRMPVVTVTERQDPPRDDLPHGARRATSRRRRTSIVLVVLLLAVVAIAIGACIADALNTPGADSVAAKLAEWGRGHGFNSEITWLEKQVYLRNQPPVGGLPPGGIPSATGALPNVAGSKVLTAAALPALSGGSALPGEGTWQTVVTVRGRPAVQVASLRPDREHTSFVVGVMRMDPALVRGELRPGTTDPGGSGPGSSVLTATDQRAVAAVFNGGFRLSDPSHPGYYSQGRTAAALVDGEASLVLHANGAADVGTWNHEVRMAPDVVSVRQNLVPLVDGGEVNPTCATGGPREWGTTVGQAAFINRSGFGVTASGVEVYVAGPALSVCTLGHILQDAGVVRGMELDINPDWVSGAYFHPQPGGAPEGFRLFPAEKVSPQHYLTRSSRDFFAWFTR